MAHRDQCGPVRGARHAGSCGVRALSLAVAVAFLSAGVALAQAPDQSGRDLAATSLPDAPAWWAEYGRPGWIADAWLGTASPWVFAGHVRGGWRLDEPGRAPNDQPAPGLGAIHTPIVWYDTVAVVAGEGGAWDGFRGALARVEGRTLGRPGAEGIIDLRSGDFGFDDNSLMVDRRDSLTWIRGEAYSSNRLGAGALDIAGRHLWGVAGGVRHGRYEVEGNFAQRGIAGSLVGTEEDHAAGASGSMELRVRGAALTARGGFGRGTNHRESFSDFYDYSRRDADELSVYGELEHRSGLAARLDYREGRVARSAADAFEWRMRSLWGAARWLRAGHEGTLTLELGAGKHGIREHPDWAPGISYQMRGGSVATRVAFERVLNAVWSDLALSEDPFLQDTWAGTLELAMGEGTRHAARVVFLGGRTRDRAVVTRVPDTEFALRTGLVADRDPWQFGVVWLDAHADAGRYTLGGEGFALARPDRDVQPRVDPDYGARGWLEGRYAAFRGDLGIRLRAGADVVGPRESEDDRTRVLPGYVTSSVAAAFTLADALITVRVRNLENLAREEPWTDSDTGDLALGPGREWRFALTMFLRN